MVQCRAPRWLHLLVRRAKRKCGAAGSEPVNASGSEAPAGAPDEPIVASIDRAPGSSAARCARMAGLAVRVGVPLPVARLRVGAAAAAHPDVARVHGPRLLAGRVVKIRLDRRRRTAQAIGDLRDREALGLSIMASQRDSTTTLLDPIWHQCWCRPATTPLTVFPRGGLLSEVVWPTFSSTLRSRLLGTRQLARRDLLKLGLPHSVHRSLLRRLDTFGNHQVRTALGNAGRVGPGVSRRRLARLPSILGTGKVDSEPAPTANAIFDGFNHTGCRGAASGAHPSALPMGAVRRLGTVPTCPPLTGPRTDDLIRGPRSSARAPGPRQRRPRRSPRSR